MRRLGPAHEQMADLLRRFEGKSAPTDAELARALSVDVREIGSMLADLSDASRIKINRRGGSRGIEVFADRFDDSDEISARIAALRANPDHAIVSETAPFEAVSQSFATDKPRKKRQAAKGAPVIKPIKSSPAKGSMPTIEWVHLDRLLVDDVYQRSVDTGPSRTLIARIGRQWDWRLCVPLMISRRDDGLYVIDGQHRLFGARLRTDIPQLPCCISKYDGPADEAAMFVAANRERRAMNRLDDFHAARAGGDGEALAVARLIEEAGFTVSRKTGSATWVPGEVAFTSAIASIRRKHGEPVIKEVLGMMAEAFAGERLVAGSSVFTALCKLLITPPPEFDKSLLPSALRTFDMPGWASFLKGAKGGDDRERRLRDMLLAAYDDVAKADAELLSPPPPAPNLQGDDHDRL